MPLPTPPARVRRSSRPGGSRSSARRLTWSILSTAWPLPRLLVFMFTDINMHNKSGKSRRPWAFFPSAFWPLRTVLSDRLTKSLLAVGG
jgi:hypothetical protein